MWAYELLYLHTHARTLLYTHTYIHTYRQADKQTDGLSDRLIYMPAHILTDNLPDHHTYSQAYIHACWLLVRQACTHPVSQTAWQQVVHTYTQTCRSVQTGSGSARTGPARARPSQATSFIYVGW